MWGKNNIQESTSFKSHGSEFKIGITPEAAAFTLPSTTRPRAESSAEQYLIV